MQAGAGISALNLLPTDNRNGNGKNRPTSKCAAVFVLCFNFAFATMLMKLHISCGLELSACK